MSEVTEMGNEKLPSVINDPFKKSKVTSVTVRAYESLSNKFIFYGRVEFKNEATKGEQEFYGSSFDDVVLKIKAMLDNLE
jgi:hypothetical protein